MDMSINTPEQNELDIYLNEDEAAELITEAESVIEAIRTGEMEGEYFEF